MCVSYLGFFLLVCFLAVDAILNSGLFCFPVCFLKTEAKKSCGVRWERR